MKLSNSFIAVKKITSSVPCSNFSEDELNLAAELILKAEGVINPLVLRRKNLQSYEVIDGHFEYYAAARAKEIDSKKGEYIGAFVIDPENEEILQQQVELFRNRESSNNDMKKKLETLTTQMAELVKRVEKLENPTTQVLKTDESVKKNGKNFSNKSDPKSGNSSEITGNESQATTSKSYDSMTVSQLKAKAKEQKINGYSKMTKEQLITVITSSDKS
jgi:hypothetical protein